MLSGTLNTVSGTPAAGMANGVAVVAAILLNTTSARPQHRVSACPSSEFLKSGSGSAGDGSCTGACAAAGCAGRACPLPPPSSSSLCAHTTVVSLSFSAPQRSPLQPSPLSRRLASLRVSCLLWTVAFTPPLRGADMPFEPPLPSYALLSLSLPRTAPPCMQGSRHRLSACAPHALATAACVRALLRSGVRGCAG